MERQMIHKTRARVDRSGREVRGVDVFGCEIDDI
jgi:hypothetical protein